MCMSCISNGEFLAINGLLAAGAMKQGAQSLCRAAGLSVGRTRLERDRHAVEFLRSLDLDAVEILGAATVEHVDAAPVPAPAPAPDVAVSPTPNGVLAGAKGLYRYAASRFRLRSTSGSQSISATT